MRPSPKGAPSALIKRLTLRQELLLVFTLLFVGATVAHWLAGTFQNELGRHPDEAAHYVTGLLVTDYLTTFPPTDPMHFAENYYVHYPKVALGHWPPFQYLLQAVWSLLFSSDRVSISILMLFITAAVATTVYYVVRQELGGLLGAISACIFLGLPIVWRFGAMVMTDMLVTLLSVWAILAFRSYMRGGETRAAISFGLLSSAAILTKGTGLSLALVPPLAVVFGRRFDLLKKTSFWSPAVIVAGLCGPWTWWTLGMAKEGFVVAEPSVDFTSKALPFNLVSTVNSLGLGLSLLLLLGVYMALIRPCWKGHLTDTWALAGAAVVSVLAFISVVPVLESRYLIQILPWYVAFIAAGIGEIASRVEFSLLPGSAAKVLVASLAIVVFGSGKPGYNTGSCYGFGEVAKRLVKEEPLANSVFLVSSDASGEGMFISEVAMREQRPGHFVLRATKVLAASQWDGKNYRALFENTKDVQEYLSEVPVEVIVFDATLPLNESGTHHHILSELLEQDHDNWEMMAAYPLVRGGKKFTDGIRVYRTTGRREKAGGKIRIDMTRTLGKVLEAEVGH